MDWADAANCETFGEEAGWDVAEAQLETVSNYLYLICRAPYASSFHLNEQYHTFNLSQLGSGTGHEPKTACGLRPRRQK